MNAPTIPPCGSCGGKRVGLDVVGQGVGLHTPGRFVGLLPLSGIRAHTCLRCGDTALVATDLDNLMAETERRPERFIW